MTFWLFVFYEVLYFSNNINVMFGAYRYYWSIKRRKGAIYLCLKKTADTCYEGINSSLSICAWAK